MPPLSCLRSREPRDRFDKAQTDRVSSRFGSPARLLAASAAALVVAATAVIAGLMSSPAGGAPVIFVGRLSSAITDYASRAGSEAWWAYAFALGAVAAFNPCGFALVPAYLGLYLKDEQTQTNTRARVLRSIRVAAMVAAAFTVLFGVTGALFSMGFSAVSSVVGRFLPWAGLGIGILLIAVAGLILAGRPLSISGPQQLASRIGKGATRQGVPGYAAFGLAYGVASLGCTLPLFLSLLGTANASGGRWAPFLSFALYGVGMATALGALTVAAGLAGVELVARARGVARFIPGLSAVLLMLSGAYIVYYWLSAGRLLL
jgi:cytochrome c-type biogenesis protein